MPDVFRSLPATAPPAPRAISADMQADSAVFGRFLRFFGGMWALVGGGNALLFTALSSALPTLSLGSVFGGLFGLTGLLLWAIGAAQRARALRVFREGVEVSGEVVEIFHDRRVRMNGRSPFRVVYTFMAGGEPRRGTATFWDPEPPVVAEGERVTVLHAPGRPAESVLWTRLERGEAPRIEAPQIKAPRIRVEEGPRAPTEDAQDELAEAEESEERTASVAKRGDRGRA